METRNIVTLRLRGSARDLNIGVPVKGSVVHELQAAQHTAPLQRLSDPLLRPHVPARVSCDPLLRPRARVSTAVRFASVPRSTLCVGTAQCGKRAKTKHAMR